VFLAIASPVVLLLHYLKHPTLERPAAVAVIVMALAFKVYLVLTPPLVVLVGYGLDWCAPPPYHPTRPLARRMDTSANHHSIWHF
jgi:hypothetical protein